MTTTTKDLYTIMQERKSVRQYDSTFKMTQAQLEEILTEAQKGDSIFKAGNVINVEDL
ncbi:MAG: hypothetical protein RR642_08065, partial [Solibacillus sp.]